MVAPSVAEINEAAHAAHSRIKSHIVLTPALKSRGLFDTLFYKAENFQRTGSFKIRGAMSKLTKVVSSIHGNAPKFVTASSGNHGIGAGTAAASLGLDMTVVLPETVSPIKLDRIRQTGAHPVLYGEEAGASEKHAQALAEEDGYIYMSPYDDADVVAGQGSIGIELLDQFDHKPIDNIFISLGGGGLVSGIGAVLKTARPETRVWGVSAKNSAALDASIKAGRIVETDHLPTLADAVAGGIDDGTITLPLATAVIDELLLCDETSIEDAFRLLAFGEGMVVEGSAALALAGYQQVAQQIAGQTTVVLLCGGNIAQDQIRALIADD